MTRKALIAAAEASDAHTVKHFPGRVSISGGALKDRRCYVISTEKGGRVWNQDGRYLAVKWAAHALGLGGAA